MRRELITQRENVPRLLRVTEGETVPCSKRLTFYRVALPLRPTVFTVQLGY